MPSARHVPTSRRALLRGGAALATGAATLTASAAQAAPGSARPPAFAAPRAGGPVRPRSADYPLAEWAPADPSNYTVATRPSSHPVHFVVIHVAQETYEDTLRIFARASSDVSAHYVVGSADGRVGQCVRERDIGWHAGNWNYNTRSVGIEHEGWVDQPAWFTEALYRSSARLTAHLCDRYAIPRTRTWIIGHNEVPGATHTDPGPLWDWERYMAYVNAM
ncbi:peptidoglycan recognition family protein [Streptomyces sp. DSM 44917]|uniref:N-acetylmuramoyl-L-alanine amidase n=1 Tax=Streptomyces boetiae TaxID=3075541 RepID=A0ABU2LBM7_9ACTN|nr:peptidoglycan recognition family protein [Streptomyces sp. DSM 44917]MDT0308707.1 peptidoglycan recognition family protein [Streptomyces sp. DSM 44917]